MNELKGTKTAENLMKAFAGESQARNRYTFYASVAKKENFVQIANLFTETAENEKEHAKLLYKHLAAAMNGEIVEITATFPVALSDTKSNLLAAAEGEKEEWEFTDEMKNNQDTTLPAGTERMVSIQIQFRQHCSLQGFLICGKQKAGFRSALEMLYLLEDCLQEQDN